MKASIILPTYNERESIPELLTALHAAMRGWPIDYELVIVDDDSPDGTAEVVRRDFGADPRVVLHERRGQRGLATAIRHGIEKSSGDVVVCMDTDFNHDPLMIPQMIKFLEFYDIVIGSRFVMRGGMEDRFREFASRIYNLGIRVLFRTPVRENLSGFFAVYREKLESMDFDDIFYGYGDYFVRLIMVAWKRGYDMLEVPVFYRLRRHGRSKTEFLATFVRYTTSLLALRLKLWRGHMR